MLIIWDRNVVLNTSSVMAKVLPINSRNNIMYRIKKKKNMNGVDMRR